MFQALGIQLPKEEETKLLGAAANITHLHGCGSVGSGYRESNTIPSAVCWCAIVISFQDFLGIMESASMTVPP